MTIENYSDFKNFLENLQSYRIYSFYSEIFEEIFAKYDVTYEIVEQNRNIDRHRWYELSETIIKVKDWYIGIFGPTKLYSESTDWEDVYIKILCYEVLKVQVTKWDYITIKSIESKSQKK